ncbi:MAG: hypothetical protein R3C10_28155 [Pirellulales bacterium]
MLRLDGPRPYIELKAKHAKNRHAATIPLHDDVAAQLREWVEVRRRGETGAVLPLRGQIRQRAADVRLFTLPQKMTPWFQIDLQVAGVERATTGGVWSTFTACERLTQHD